MVKIAFYSGGKDSVYTYLLEKPVDLLFFSIYSFPRPSPHIVNIGKALEVAAALGVPVVAAPLPKGYEFTYKADLLKKLGASVLVAGDQAVEDHLAYMKRLADSVGAELKEPLWGRDPREILLEEIRHMDFVVIGAVHEELICKEVNRENVLEFLGLLERLGVDPIGERGEYHSQVVRVGDVRVEYRCGGVLDFGSYYIAKLL